MKKLKINTAAFILNIIGASFYLIGLIIAFTAMNYLHLLTIINIVTMTIWMFSLGAAIVSIIALVMSRKYKIRIVGAGAGLIGHLLYFLFGIYPAPFCIVLCIMGAILVAKDNHYEISNVHQPVDVVDVEIDETMIDEQV